MSQPDAAQLLGALPEPAALLDSVGRFSVVNSAFRAAVGGGIPLRSGEKAARLLPEAEQAIAGALRGQVGRAVLLRAGLALRATPCAGGALLTLADLHDGPGERLAILGRLAGGIAHDFNNLLSVVLGAAAAARSAPLDPQVAGEIAAVEAAAERGGLLVRQLLAFARQQVLAPQLVQLNDTVREFVALLPRLLGSGIEVVTSLEEPSRIVRIDPAQWSRVLLNLAVNARDAMGGQGRLTFATGRRLVLAGEVVAGEPLAPGRYAMIEVSDTGPGIPPEVRAHIFEPFFTTKLEQGGTGLGLATVQGIVAQSGGVIEVDCPPGGGTRFRILLPRAEPAEEAPALDPAPPSAALPAGPILLVDDERTLLRVATIALRHAGHEVVACEDADEAMERVAEGLRPALLASDVAMPGMDGIALARALRARLPGLPVLLMSGYSAASVAGAPAREGFRFLAKPFTAQSLNEAVRAALEGG